MAVTAKVKKSGRIGLTLDLREAQYLHCVLLKHDPVVGIRDPYVPLDDALKEAGVNPWDIVDSEFISP